MHRKEYIICTKQGLLILTDNMIRLLFLRKHCTIKKLLAGLLAYSYVSFLPKVLSSVEY